MAFQTSLITVKGKIGNIVGMKGKGRWLARERVYEIKNPKTQKQEIQRAKIAMFGQLAGKMKSLINQTFKNSKKTSFSMFIDRNFEVGIGGNYPNLEFLFNKITLSEGTVVLPDNASGAIDSGMLSVSWNDNSGIDGALASDGAILAVYNSHKDQFLYEAEGTRSDRQTSMTLPTSWTGDTIECWILFKGKEAENEGKYSPSQYLGSIAN